jgi:hypothetical protein
LHGVFDKAHLWESIHRVLGFRVGAEQVFLQCLTG